ncbi:tape measure protein [Emticicia sp. 17c]|uniref:tape measure protein n=1 Tax=Emticicia sp. 17c TaxID=3127704 RepID=UPI00301B6EDC
MPTTLNPQNIINIINNDNFAKAIENMISKIKGLEAEAVAANNNIADSILNVGNLADAYSLIEPLSNLAAHVIEVRNEFDNLELSFSKMLKTKAEVDTLMQEVVNLSATSPFSVQAIGESTKSLLDLGNGVGGVIEAMKILGDVSAGASVSINELSGIYAKLSNQAFVTGSDLDTLASKNIPIYQELANVLNLSVAEVERLAATGKIGADEIQMAFQRMAGEGGIFNGEMAKQSETLNGLLAQLANAFTNMFNEIGQSQSGIMTSTVKGLTFIVEHYETIGKILKAIIYTYGLYKATLLLVAVAEEVVTLATNKLNFALSKNPVGFVATALASLVAVLWAFSDSTDEATKKQEEFNKVQEENARKKEELLQKTTQLTNVIRDETASRVDQLNAFEELKKLYPEVYGQMDIETYKKKSAIQTQKELNKALEDMKLAEIEQDYKKTQESVVELTKKLEDLKESKKLTGNQGNGLQEGIDNTENALETATIRAALLKEELEKQKKLHFENNTSLEDQLKYYTEIKNKLENSKKEIEGTLHPFVMVRKEADLTQSLVTQMRLYGFINDLNDVNKKINNIKWLLTDKNTTFTESLSNAINTKDVGGLINLRKSAVTENQTNSLVQAVRQLKADLDKSSPAYKDLEKLYNQLTGRKSTGSSGNTPAPFGTLAYWKNISQEAQKMLEKINPFAKGSEAKIKQLQQQKINADQKAEEASKAIAIKSFDDRLNEQKKLYAQYQQWVNTYGTASAKAEFSNLEETGYSYSQYLQTEIQKLEAKLNSGEGDTKDRDNLLKLKEESTRVFEAELTEKKKKYEQYNRWVRTYGKKTADEQFSDLQAAGSSFEQYLQNQIQQLSSRQSEGLASSQDLDRLVLYKDALENTTHSFEQYKNQLIAAGEKTGSLTEYLRLLGEEQAKIKDPQADPDKSVFLNQQIEATEAKRKELLKVFLTENALNEEKRLQIQQKYTDLRAQLDKEYVDKKSETYKKALALINDDEKQALENNDIVAVQKNSAAYKELTKIIDTESRKQLVLKRNTLQAYLNELKEKNLEETEEYRKKEKEKQQVDKEIVNKDKALLDVFEKFGQELSGLEGFAGNFGKLLMDASKAANTLFTSIQEGASSTEKITSVTNFFFYILGQMVNQQKEQERIEKNNLKVLKDYNEALFQQIKLRNTINSNGFTKNYQGIISDSNNALAMANSNYEKSIDAIQHSKGWKKVNSGFLSVTIRLKSLLNQYPELINASKELNTELAEYLLKTEGRISENERMLLEDALDAQKQIESAKKQLDDIINDLVGQIGDNLRNALVNAFENGTSAAKAFGDTVSNVLESIISQTLFSAVFGQAFDTLRKEMQQSLSADGDRILTDDIERFFKDYPQLIEQFNSGLLEAQKQAEQQGFDIFKSSSSDSNSLSGSIKGITEETAGVLEGQINAMRITQAVQLDVSRNQLLALTEIATNSRFLKHLERLENIEKKLVSSNTELRANGGI